MAVPRPAPAQPTRPPLHAQAPDKTPIPARPPGLPRARCPATGRRGVPGRLSRQHPGAAPLPPLAHVHAPHATLHSPCNPSPHVAPTLTPSTVSTGEALAAAVVAAAGTVPTPTALSPSTAAAQCHIILPRGTHYLRERGEGRGGREERKEG